MIHVQLQCSADCEKSGCHPSEGVANLFVLGGEVECNANKGVEQDDGVNNNMDDRMLDLYFKEEDKNGDGAAGDKVIPADDN